MPECAAFNQDGTMGFWIVIMGTKGEIACNSTAGFRCDQIGCIGIYSKLHVRRIISFCDVRISRDIIQETITMLEGGCCWFCLRYRQCVERWKDCWVNSSSIIEEGSDDTLYFGCFVFCLNVVKYLGLSRIGVGQQWEW